MGYTIGKVFKKDEIVSKVETEQEESVVNINFSEQTDIDNVASASEQTDVDNFAAASEQADVEETDNTNSDDSANDEAKAPAKTTRRGRKKE